MTTTSTLPIGTEFKVDGIVRPADGLAWIEAPDGAHIACDTLGPGVVEEVHHEGDVKVHWTEGGFSNWIDPEDIVSAGENAHLITVYNRSKEGLSHMARRRVVAQQGLDRNWIVELLPDHIVRVIRHDGMAWTFKYNWLFERIEVWWPQPPRDEDAEALAVAELAVS
jgi:hypothetical protein